MKKYLVWVISLTSFLFITCNIVKAGEPIKGSELIHISGTTMTAKEFRDTYSLNPNLQQSAHTSKKTETSEIEISNTKIDNDVICFDAKLLINGKTINLPVNGKLGSSFKNQRGINSTIVYVKKPISGYDVLHFEIYNDTEHDNLLLDSMNLEQDLSTMPHLKVYLKDENDKIYLFESAMPECFRSIDAINYTAAPKENDAYWTYDLVDHVVDEVPTDEAMKEKLGLVNKASGYNQYTTWQNATTFHSAFNAGGEWTECWSLPYVEYKYVDVTKSDSTWVATFKVAERMECAGYTYHGNNVFSYRNLKIAFACGDKSTFISTEQQGRMNDVGFWRKKLMENGQNITVNMLTKVVDSLPNGSTFSNVLGFINSIDSSREEVTLGSNYKKLYSQKTVAVGEKLDDMEFEECTNYNGYVDKGDYFTYQAKLQYEQAGGNTNTVGALVFSFDKYYSDDGSLTPIKQQEIKL